MMSYSTWLLLVFVALTGECISAVSPLLSYSYRHGVCEFPSIYRDKVIRQCQLDSGGQWWCPRDENYDLYHQRVLCPNTSMTYAGSDPGQLCHFPFLYNGKRHSACIRTREEASGSLYWWCATTNNYDTDKAKRWTRCIEQSEQLPCFFKEEGGTGISTECRLFNDKWVCHTEHSEIRECPQTDSTFAGNSPGQACHFPFLFGQKEYRSCISARRPHLQSHRNEEQFESYLWCATTANYNNDRLWTKCIDQDSFLRLTDRRVIIPVSVVLGMLMLVLCLAAILHLCSHGAQSRKHYPSNSAPHLHISMLDIANDVLPSAPPSYLEAVMSSLDQVVH